MLKTRTIGLEGYIGKPIVKGGGSTRQSYSLNRDIENVDVLGELSRCSKVVGYKPLALGHSLYIGAIIALGDLELLIIKAIYKL